MGMLQRARSFLAGQPVVTARDVAREIVEKGPSDAWAGVPSGMGGGWFSMVRESFAGAWQRNITWNQDSALSNSAMYACVTQISTDVGKMRFILKQQVGKVWVELDNSSPSSPFAGVLRKPNGYQSHIQFKESWILSKLIRGNAYILLERDNRNLVVGMYVLDPSRVTPMVAPNGDVFYKVSPDNLSGLGSDDQLTIPASEIIHDRMNCLFHPLVGISPLYASGLQATQGNKITEDSIRFFQNASMPGGILTTAQPIGQQIAKEYKEAWDGNFSGANAGKIAVLGNGLTFMPTRMTSLDAQTIEQLKLTASMICTTFKIPGFIVGVGEFPRGMTNVQALWSMYYVQCLQTYVESMEQLINDALGFSEPSGGARALSVELDVSMLLRMDTETKTATTAAAITAGFMTVNEARLQFDLSPVKGGDTIYLQQQNWPIDQLANRPAPAATPAATPAPDEPKPNPDDPKTDDEEGNQTGDNAESKQFIAEVDRLMKALIEDRPFEPAD